MAESRRRDESATLQSLLEAAGTGRPDGSGAAQDAEPTVTDPVALLRHLDVSGHFHRDGPLGRLFHRGMVSLRENVPTDSLHVSVEDNRMAAHVDGVSPLVERSGGGSGYSLRRAVAHNLFGMAQDVVSFARGRQGDHRCELNCEWVPGAAGGAPGDAALLDPEAGAWSVQMEARVAGALDEARLRAALGSILGDRPLQRDPLDVLDCPDEVALDAARARLHSAVVIATEHPPLHVFLARHDAGDVLMLSLNHAASDGVGAVRVLDAIARAYAGEADPALPLDFLAVRDLPVRPARPPVPVVVRAYTGAVERLRDVLTRPARLAAEQPGGERGYGFHLVSLSVEETGRLVDVTRSGTNRDVLLAALHLAIGDWNLEHGTPGRRIGVLVPANLRPPEWRQETVGNFSVTARVSTNRRERAGTASALKAVSAQTTRNKRTRTGIALIAALERAGLLPLWAKQSTVVLQPLTGNRLVDTAMLGYLGRLEAPSFGPDAGEVVQLWFSTPARSPVTLCVGAVTVGGRLHLTFRYPHRVFGADAARRFAACYLEQLRLVARNRA